MTTSKRLLDTILLMQIWLFAQNNAIVLPDSSSKHDTSTVEPTSSKDQPQDRMYHVSSIQDTKDQMQDRMYRVSSIQDIIQRYTKQPSTSSGFVVADYLSQGREADTTNIPKGRVLDEAQVYRMITNSEGRQPGVGPPYGFYDRRLLDTLLAKIQGSEPQTNPSYERPVDPSPSLRHYGPLTQSILQQLQHLQLQQLKQQQELQEQQYKLQQQLRTDPAPVSTQQPARTVEQLPYGLMRLPLGIQNPQYLDAYQVMAGLQKLANIQRNLYSLSTAASEHRSRGLSFELPPPGTDPLLVLLLSAAISPQVTV